MLYSLQWTMSGEQAGKRRRALCTFDSLPHGAYENNIDCVYTPSGIAKTRHFYECWRRDARFSGFYCEKQ